MWQGREAEAIRQLQRYIEHKANISSFEKLNVTSQSLISSSTGLSCYLRFGYHSPRLLYHSMRTFSEQYVDRFIKVK
uniref:Uncharacterized protein n=1 Tax=Lepeophtheirus salmonis TaxID=72036 RepID=A0A0K2UJH8_LEPSM